MSCCGHKSHVSLSVIGFKSNKNGILPENLFCVMRSTDKKKINNFVSVHGMRLLAPRNLELAAIISAGFELS